MVVDELVALILKHQTKFLDMTQLSEESRTFVPYYDSIIEKELRGDLTFIKMDQYTKAKVNNQHLRASMLQNSKDMYLIQEDGSDIKQKTSSKDLITYMPNKNAKSKILNDLQISNLICCLPQFYRTNDWNLIFDMDRHGCSLITFF